MKKIVSLILVAVIVFSFGATASAAAAVQIEAETVTTSQGKAVEVPVKIKNNSGFAAVEIQIEYNKEFFTLAEVQKGLVKNLTFETGSGMISGAYGRNITGDGTLFTLVFKCAEKAPSGEYPIKIKVNELFNIYDKNLSPKVTNGKIVVIDYIPGDINEDGIVNARDSQRLYEHLVGRKPLAEGSKGYTAADVNADGMINARDSQRLYEHLVGRKPLV